MRNDENNVESGEREKDIWRNIEGKVEKESDWKMKNLRRGEDKV